MVAEIRELSTVRGQIDYLVFGTDAEGPFMHRVTMGSSPVEGEWVNVTLRSTRCPTTTYELRVLGISPEEIRVGAMQRTDLVNHSNPLDRVAIAADHRFRRDPTYPTMHIARYDPEGIVQLVAESQAAMGMSFDELVPENVWQRLKE